MSRNKGTFNFANTFEVQAKQPLDARQVVGSVADLINPATWQDVNNNVWLYNGAIVAIASGGTYQLIDANNYTSIASWQKFGSSSGGTGTITGATNGLMLFDSGHTIGLGGALTEDVMITGAHKLETRLDDYIDLRGTYVYLEGFTSDTGDTRFSVFAILPSFAEIAHGNGVGQAEGFQFWDDKMVIYDDLNHKGVQYFDNYSLNFVDRSLVDKAFVMAQVATGGTGVYLPIIDFNYYSGTTAPNTFLNINNFIDYTGTTAPNIYATILNFNTHTGDTTIHRTSGDTQSQINNSLLDYYTSGQTNSLLNFKLNTSVFNGFTGTTLPANYLGIHALNGYWNSGQTVSYINGRGFLTSASLNGYWTSAQTTNYLGTHYWTSAQTSTFVTTRGYVTSAIINGIWNSGQTISYINGRGFLTGVTWNIIAGKPDLWTTGQTVSWVQQQNYLTGFTVTCPMVTGCTDALYLHNDALDLYWDSGQTVSYINGRGFLTGVTVSMITGVTSTLYAPIVHYHAQYLTGITWGQVSGKPNLVLKADYDTYTGTTAPLQFASKVHYHAQYLTGFTVTCPMITGCTDLLYLHNDALDFYWNSGETMQAISAATSGLTSSWSGLTGNPTGSTALMNLFADYVDYVTYNFNNNVLSQELQSIDNQLAWLSGNTIQSLAGYWTSGQTTAWVGLQGFLTSSALNGYWNSGQTISYINGRNFLTGVTWGQVSGKSAWLTGSTAQIFSSGHTHSQYELHSAIVTYTGTTAPATYATIANAITGGTNQGSGQGIYTGTTANKLKLRSIKVTGSGLSISSDATSITISGSTSGTWGSITGSLAAQTDLQSALDLKADKTAIAIYTGTTAPASYLPYTPSIVSLTGATLLSATHANKIVECNGTFTVTLPNSMVKGMRVDIVNIGTGTITLAASTTLVSAGTKLVTRYTGASAYHRGSNVWLAMGKLTS